MCEMAGQLKRNGAVETLEERAGRATNCCGHRGIYRGVSNSGDLVIV